MLKQSTQRFIHSMESDAALRVVSLLGNLISQSDQ